MLSLGLCRLCEDVRELELSHIMPKFVFRWQHDTAVSAIRDSESPNRRSQDGRKQPFLCSQCEDRLQSFETPFASKVFHPAHQPVESLPSVLNYGTFGLKFAVSVSWRALRLWSEDPRFPEILGPVKHALALRALQRWRSFLLGEVPHPAEFEQHLLTLSFTETAIPGQSPSFNRYALRAVDQTFAHSSEIMFVYSKLGRVVIFGMLPPSARVPGWRNTKLHVSRGVIPLRDAILEIPQAIADFMNARAEYGAQTIASVSPRQQALIDRAFQERIRTNPSGELFEALVRDYELFGDEALNRKFPDDDRNA
jgi:hypothetical protein